MSLKVGRLSFEFADDSITRMDWDGDRLHMEGYVTRIGDGTSAAAAVEILNSYQGGSDESVIPVVWTGQANVTGFYTVRSAGLTGGRVSAGHGVWALDLDLERVRGYAAPAIESVLIGGQRATSVAGQVTGRAWHAVPAAAVGYETGILTPSVLTLASETGDLSYFYEGTQSTRAHFYNARPTWYLAPGDWYDGAAEVKVGGYVVAGRQCQNLPTNWTISNGLVRLTSSGAAGVLTSERWNGTAWADPGAWKIGRTLGTGVGITIDLLVAPHTLTILRNDPACVAVRCAYDAAGTISGSRFAVFVDYSLRRGSSLVEVSLSTKGEYRWGFYSPITYASLTLGNDAATDATFVAAGVSEFSANDDGAGKTRLGLTTYTGNGRTFDQWGWGYLVGGQSFLFVSQQYASAQSERVQVVAR